jgi:outer membrane protein TolC
MNIFFILLFTPFLLAKKITVQELLKSARSYSPEIKAEAFQQLASKAAINQARVYSNPIFTFQGGSLASATQRGSVSDFTLNQPLPWPGKRKVRVETHEFLQKISELAKSQVELEVMHRVFVLSSELGALQELETHYQERKKRFSLIERSLKSRPQASPKQKVDRDLIESQIKLLEKGMIDFLARKEALNWELRILGNTNFDEVIFPWENLPKALSREQYLEAIGDGPIEKRLRLQEKVAQNKIEEARLEARPDVMVGVNYRQENVAPVNHFYHGQVSVVIPIVDYGQHSVEEARAQEMKVKASHQLERDNLKALLHHQYALYESRRKSLDIFPLKDVKRIETKFYDAEDSFRKGFIDALTFLQIDSQIHENIDQIFLSRVEYVSALSELNLLIGKGPEI